MLILNQNIIELPHWIFQKYKGKSVIVREEDNKIIIEEDNNPIKISELRGCLENSNFNTESFTLIKQEEKELEV